MAPPYHRLWGTQRLGLSRLRPRDRSSERSWFSGGPPERAPRATPGGIARATILQRSVPEAIRLLTRVISPGAVPLLRAGWQMAMVEGVGQVLDQK